MSDDAVPAEPAEPAVPAVPAATGRALADPLGLPGSPTASGAAPGGLFHTPGSDLDDRVRRRAATRARPGVGAVLEPPAHRRPSGADPGITVSGGRGGIRARLEDLERAAAVLSALAEDLASATDQAHGAARDAEAWSLRLQDRRARAADATGEPAGAARYADEAVAAYRARLATLVLVADACAARTSRLGEDVADVVAALAQAGELYRGAEADARGAVLSSDRPAVRALLALSPGANLLRAGSLGALWGGANAADAAAGTVGWDLGARRRLPDTQELVTAQVDLVRRATTGPFAVDEDPRGSLAWAGRVLGGGFDAVGLLRREARVAPQPGQPFVPRATDLASSAVALAAVGRGPAGAVGVQRARRADGRSAWTVFVPGTQAGLAERSTHGRDWPSAVATVSGSRLAATRGAAAALRAAGARPGDAVSFVGHSQGGAIAKQLAADPEVRGRYVVGSVVAFAGPEPADVPRDVPGVSYVDVANTRDVVVATDGRPPEAGPGHVTVEIDDARLADGDLRRRSADQSGRHAMATFVAAAPVVARGTDPSLRAAAQRLAHDLTGRDPAPVGRSPGALLDQVEGGVRIYVVTAR